MVKNLPAKAGDTKDVGSIPELRRSLGVGNGNPLQFILAWKIPWDRGDWQATGPWGCKESDMTEQLNTYTQEIYLGKTSIKMWMFITVQKNPPLGKSKGRAVGLREGQIQKALRQGSACMQVTQEGRCGWNAVSKGTKQRK